MQTVVATARRAYPEGESVSASERAFSLFEPRTELLQRGQRQKPVEFGHKVQLCQAAEKFIIDQEDYEEQQPDYDLTEPVIQGHKTLFGARPVVLVADKGYCPEKKSEQLAKLAANLVIPRRMQDFMDKLFNSCQAFRAGIERIISGLNRHGVDSSVAGIASVQTTAFTPGYPATVCQPCPVSIAHGQKLHRRTGGNDADAVPTPVIGSNDR